MSLYFDDVLLVDVPTSCVPTHDKSMEILFP